MAAWWMKMASKALWLARHMALECWEARAALARKAGFCLVACAGTAAVGALAWSAFVMWGVASWVDSSDRDAKSAMLAVGKCAYPIEFSEEHLGFACRSEREGKWLVAPAWAIDKAARIVEERYALAEGGAAQAYPEIAAGRWLHGEGGPRSVRAWEEVVGFEQASSASRAWAYSMASGQEDAAGRAGGVEMWARRAADGLGTLGMALGAGWLAAILPAERIAFAAWRASRHGPRAARRREGLRKARKMMARGALAVAWAIGSSFALMIGAEAGWLLASLAAGGAVAVGAAPWARWIGGERFSTWAEARDLGAQAKGAKLPSAGPRRL